MLVPSAKMILEYDEIVIGGNLIAALYAFNKKLPIFFTIPQRPFKFDYLDPALDVCALHLHNEPRTIVTHAMNINVGAAKELLWERLLFLISLAGRAPLSTFCESMRHNGKTIVCSNEYSKIAEIKFEKAYYFGDDSCSGLVTEKTVANPLYICYDWIAFNRGGKHEIDLIETSDNFVNKIWFYPTDRVDGNSSVKDACLVSTLTEEQLLNFDYSQTMARFKMVAEMRKRGMRGLFNGYSPTGVPKYYKFRTTVIGRERYKKLVCPQPSIEEIEIPQIKEEDLLKDLPQACVGYHRFLDNL
jgi:hypothetical protein